MTTKAADVGELLRMCREWAELSQLDLSRLLKMSRSTVSRIENGHEQPELDLIVDWAKATGCEGIVNAYVSQAIGGQTSAREFLQAASLVREVANSISKFQTA